MEVHTKEFQDSVQAIMDNLNKIKERHKLQLKEKFDPQQESTINIIQIALVYITPFIIILLIILVWKNNMFRK